MANTETVKGTSLWKDAWKRLLKNKLAVFGLIVLVVMIIAVIIGPSILYWTTGFTAESQPSEGDLLKSFPPSLQHPMGTDELGRDLLARVLQGGRISLMVGIISTIVSLIIGVSYGAIAGYLGGGIDNLMMRIVDIIYSIPYILVVIVLLSVFGGPNTPVLISWLPQVLAALVLLIVLIPVAVLIYRRLVEHFTDVDGIILFLLKILYTIGVLAVIAAVVIVTGYLLILGNVGTYWARLYSGNVNQ